MKVKVLLNPYARICAARPVESTIAQALEAADLSYDLVRPDGPTGMRRAAMLACSAGYEAVVAAGGDGTVNAVLNGLIVAAGSCPTCPLGILPLGTGNDFSDMMGLPRNLNQAARIIAAGKTVQIDAGQVNFTAEPESMGNGWQSRYFANNCAVAMEPLVTMETARIRHLKGNIRYVAGMLRGFVKLRAWRMHIDWDGGSLQAPTYLLSVANTPRTGGQFMIAPNARSDDGLLDMIYSPRLPRHEVLALLPRLFNGSHLGHAAIMAQRTSRVIVESKPATPVHADGEVICPAASRLSFQVLPGKLSLLCGPGSPNGH